MNTALIVALIGFSASLAGVAISQFLKERHRRSELLMVKSEESIKLLLKLRAICQRQFEKINDYILHEEGVASAILDMSMQVDSLNSELRMYTNIYFPSCDSSRNEMYRIFIDVQLEYSLQLDKLDAESQGERVAFQATAKVHHIKFNELIKCIANLENSLISNSPRWNS
ncbi:hypothetical protein [Thalassomonas actiniarum]|uniref:Uncharacterized protein n=1 Tax=Thalassomonas actiniarum TaxID=485447 RepID=A0AAE9YU19_9GAMM|nr:hypothetical protein [Thalassomonas actiniarum]WDE00339.1 hypothetical protein SG35_006770 [Thalassomonas actiniarum]